jgi:hypothetical protein
VLAQENAHSKVGVLAPLETPRRRLEAVLLQGRPDAFCFPCLGTRLAMPATRVRDAAQLVIVNPDFRVRRGPCRACGRTDEVMRFVRRSEAR